MRSRPATAMPASAAAPLNRLRSPLLRAAIDAFDEAGPDAAFEQGLAVIVDGLAKRRLVVRNVEGPRKGDD